MLTEFAPQLKGFIDWLQQADPDVICLQEIKASQISFRYWISNWLDIPIITGFPRLKGL
jgi:exonuclease III